MLETDTTAERARGTRSPGRLAALLFVGAVVLAVLVVLVVTVIKVLAPSVLAPSAHNTDPRAYPGSSATSLNQDLATDQLTLPGGVSAVRFKSPGANSAFPGEFLLTFTVPKAGMARFLALNPQLAGPKGGGLSNLAGGVQPDIRSSVGWVLPSYSDAVYGASGDIADGNRTFEMSVDERAAATDTVYYVSFSS